MAKAGWLPRGLDSQRPGAGGPGGAALCRRTANPVPTRSTPMAPKEMSPACVMPSGRVLGLMPTRTACLADATSRLDPARAGGRRRRAAIVSERGGVFWGSVNRAVVDRKGRWLVAGGGEENRRRITLNGGRSPHHSRSTIHVLTRDDSRPMSPRFR